MIELSGVTPIARGGERELFPYPADPSRILKVLVPDGETSKGGPARAFFSRLFAGYRKRLLQREFDEYERLTLKYLDRKTSLPVAHMFGFVPTDRGMAAVSEAVRTQDGALGPTWRQLEKQGDIGPREAQAFATLGRELITLGVRCSDLTAGNIVLGHRTIAGQIGPFEAVLVDGFGDTHAVPVRTWSRRANTYSIHKRLIRIGRRSNLFWDSNDLVFQGIST